MIKAGIIGGSGYVAGELLRSLSLHPHTSISFVHSRNYAGQSIQSVHEDLYALRDISFTSEIITDVDVIFLSLGHGHSKEILEKTSLSPKTKIIDMSNEFRLKDAANFKGNTFVYGLTSLNKEKIQSTQFIANPGCFATAIQQALLPLAKAQWIDNEIHVHALTGSTGAGRSLLDTTHFSWRSNNISIYKAFRHQHLDEIRESLQQLQEGFDQEIHFLPLRGDFSRGIFASVYMKTDRFEEELNELYRSFYKDAPFTHISDSSIHLKQVVNTNNSILQIQKIDGKVLITSIIDNLLKGAAGQAIENLNLMYGWPQDTGLQFKANYF